MSDDGLLNTIQAAVICGVTEKRMREWRSQGRGPRYIKLGDSRNAPVRYRRRDLERWLVAHEHDGTFEYAA